jgi:hypothetical protein
MSVLPMPLFVIPLAITPAGVVPIRAVLVVPVGLVPFPLDGGGFSALGSGFNIQVLG